MFLQLMKLNIRVRVLTDQHLRAVKLSIQMLTSVAVIKCCCEDRHATIITTYNLSNCINHH